MGAVAYDYDIHLPVQGIFDSFTDFRAKKIVKCCARDALKPSLNKSRS